MFNLINHQVDIDKISFSTKNPYEANFKLLMNKRESRGLKYLNDSKVLIKNSNAVDDIHKNIQEYNSNKKLKTLTVFDDMSADILISKPCNPIVTELFIRGRKLNISLVFIAKSYFAVILD